MVKKRIDNRIRVLIENGVNTKQRSMFVVIGDKARDQTVILHHMLSKAQIKARPSVLWCYKKELGFSSHRKKRMRQLQKKIQYGKLDVKEDDPFELFVASTNIRYCYYNETHKILGSTFGMLILQDFEAITPNLLARTIETIEGGGIVVILLRTMSSLKQFYTMSMDVHSRFRTESHQDVVARFNERFLLSLSTNKRCLVVDDQLNILPISSKTLVIEPVIKSTDDELSKEDKEFLAIKESLVDTQPASSIIGCCKTLDQAKCVLKFIDSISEKQLRSTISLTAARGRGKSAALGLSIASAVAFGYSNIFVTSPTPENLKTLFDFVLKGFDALDYQEHVDYKVVQSTNPEFNNAVIRIDIDKDHRQTIQYINPKDSAQLGQAELLVIDEAAAIPLPLVKNLLGPYLVFMSSTINGYEGTGRSLSLKLLQQLRQQTSSLSGASANVEVKKQVQLSASGKTLYELQLNESIRYANGDLIEKWLNDLLCLNCCQQVITPELRLKRSCPIPESCDLYYINRDTLFSYHKISELFLQHLMSLYVASHYKNSPNDLQMLSDAPAHHLFCLLGPFNNKNSTETDKIYQLPEILCVVQVCLEGNISKDSVVDNLKRGKRANGDLIPWTVSQQFNDSDFPNLLGARIVRIATNPDYQSMGYGSRALKLLEEYYEGKIVDINEGNEENNLVKVHDDEEKSNEENLNEISDVDLLTETIEPKKKLPPLLLKLNERRCERLDYLGVSFGLTNDLLRFWKKSSFLPVYLRQTTNDLTGEHSCIMIKELNRDVEKKSNDSWLLQYFIGNFKIIL
jgi:N-acetyltransferase 10